jgi:hypothetical protein
VIGGAVDLDVRELRHTAAAMLGLALVLPALPGDPGVPCPLRMLTGIPCPLCGMTTSVEDTAHGHLVAAAAANPAGILLSVVAAILLVKRPERVVLSRAALLAALGGMWAFELHRFGLV